MPSDEFEALVKEGRKLQKQLRELTSQFDEWKGKVEKAVTAAPPKKKKGFWDDPDEEDEKE